jgi:hypothetical protein
MAFEDTKVEKLKVVGEIFRGAYKEISKIEF